LAESSRHPLDIFGETALLTKVRGDMISESHILRKINENTIIVEDKPENETGATSKWCKGFESLLDIKLSDLHIVSNFQINEINKFEEHFYFKENFSKEIIFKYIKPNAVNSRSISGKGFDHLTSLYGIM
jgi:hypothetical protein